MAKQSQKRRGTTRGARVREVPGPVEALGTRRTVESVNLADIDLEDTRFQFRVTLRVADLVESIRRHGQQMPVILRRQPDRPKLQVVSGFRRIA
ncbi:MAG TPA: ParB N-terminal domain-containing protein, partial [Myxococcota bacterium]|nr:ParB N-terminal domain-containing protein [Myxococcota bacterium]HQK51920.1 ParB N-terminal domain-containing protein [Myxococcota bacterium]